MSILQLLWFNNVPETSDILCGISNGLSMFLILNKPFEV